MRDQAPFDYGSSSSVGITFHLRFRRRFIPHAWLLYADMDEKGTEIQLHYTHMLVTVHGTNLSALHERVAQFTPGWVQEKPTMPKEYDTTITRIEITEKVSD